MRPVFLRASSPAVMPSEYHCGELALGGLDAFFEHLGCEVAPDAPVAVDEGCRRHVGADAVGEAFLVADVGHEAAGEAAAEGGGADAQGEGVRIAIAETGGLAPDDGDVGLLGHEDVLIARGVDGAGFGGGGLGGRTPPVQPAKTFETSDLRDAASMSPTRTRRRGGGAVVFCVEGLHFIERDFLGAGENLGGGCLAVGVADGIHGAGEGCRRRGSRSRRGRGGSCRRTVS
jgi:hypothetical protein